jgi:hypothetical protein
MVVSALSGMPAGAIFKHVCKVAAGKEEAPMATGIRCG